MPISFQQQCRIVSQSEPADYVPELFYIVKGRMAGVGQKHPVMRVFIERTFVTVSLQASNFATG
jgi:hypothetical protein